MTTQQNLALLAAALLLASCGGSSPAPAQKQATASVPAPKPVDESRRLPKENQVGTEVVERQLMGKGFMPGGTSGRYRKGKQEYELFLAQMPTANDAAIALLDWKRAMKDAKMIPAFGAYYGTDRDRPVFVFTKGRWVAGVAGLSERQADPPARVLASRLSFED
ncbi:MAG TPA: hypothetical protein VES20_17150 [Bryobacteraceae bacterium]|nr:hypothetical protein [Bryobacteraceae bacterium]